MERTPSPPRRLHTPPAPHLGAKHDSYEPFSPRPSRRSTRVAQRELDHHQEQQPRPRDGRARDVTPTSSRKAPAARASLQGLSPPSSPISPNKHHSPRSTKRARFVQSSLDSDSDSGRFAPTPARNLLSSLTAQGMLPTPAKTPSKRHLQTEEILGPTARVLFASPRHTTIDEAMPTPRKGRKAQIAIFTDSKDRVPEINEEEDNPFLTRRGKGKGKAPARATVKPRKVDEAAAKMQEAADRDDGLIYIFRGKKVFRKLQDGYSGASDEEPSISDARIRRQIGFEAHRPITRSTTRPKKLFEEEIRQQRLEREAEEEAQTDIEEHIATPSNRKGLRNGGISRYVDQEVTPPPTERRVKRQISFESWSRTKVRDSSSSREDKKRSGEPLESSFEKRTRSEPSSAMSLDSI